jgi:hypothetical protein
MTTKPCAKCSEGPKGEAGHDALKFYVEGPFPAQHIFKCDECGERWIRHYGSTAERFAWTRYDLRSKVST